MSARQAPAPGWSAPAPSSSAAGSGRAAERWARSAPGRPPAEVAARSGVRVVAAARQGEPGDEADGDQRSPVPSQEAHVRAAFLPDSVAIGPHRQPPEDAAGPAVGHPFSAHSRGEEMTDKTDFTEEEWKLVLQGPTSAGLLVVASDQGVRPRELLDGQGVRRGAPAARRERAARRDHLGQARGRQVPAPLLRGAEGTRPPASARRGPLLEQKATPDEVEEYKRFIVNLAERVAEARKEGFLGLSGERVSPDERAALEQIAEALGTEAPSTPDAP